MGESRRVPSFLIGALLATAISSAILVVGLNQPSEGGCDGGLCALDTIVAWGIAIVAWPVAFSITTLLAWAARRRDGRGDEGQH